MLLACGAKLQSHLPLEWVEEFPSKAAFLAWRRDRNNPALQPEIIVTLNFIPEGVNAKEIAKIYDEDDNGADAAFIAEASNLGLPGPALEKLLAMHSRAMVSSMHEALDYREWLIARMAQCPETGKWIRVRSTGPLCGLFGKLASSDKIADVLNSIA